MKVPAMDANEDYAAAEDAGNATTDSEQCHSTPEYVPFLVTAQLIIAAMAIVGNGITLAMISKHPTLRQAKGIFASWLGIGPS